MWETWVWSLDWKDPLEKGKATHSSILAWRIPWAVCIVHGVAKSRTWLSNSHFHFVLLRSSLREFPVTHTCQAPSTFPLSFLTGSPPSLVLMAHSPVFKQWLLNQQGFPASSDCYESACNAGDPGSVLEVGRSPGEGNSNPLQYSCLENPKDRGAWQATVHGVTESDTTEQVTLLLLWISKDTTVTVKTKQWNLMPSDSAILCESLEVLFVKLESSRRCNGLPRWY